MDAATSFGALGANQPVILNQVVAESSGNASHSVIGYGLVRQGAGLFVQAADPDWVASNAPNAPYNGDKPTYPEPWEDVPATTVSVTYIDPGR